VSGAHQGKQGRVFGGSEGRLKGEAYLEKLFSGARGGGVQNNGGDGRKIDLE